ncbi:hypothetical protein PHYPSEUDO_011747 [Phytophthora pseudosyringae]|uniref:Glycosyl transferase family 1 domain-containing protein n=1 Tax=Phytophthora pseudosyringae TaxID=221518 RepID=A0A8T1V7U7_9STRA|nr:hypothetical protein PHYPSEUDO_011747 [Phytophthora pseudosyringae]
MRRSVVAPRCAFTGIQKPTASSKLAWLASLPLLLCFPLAFGVWAIWEGFSMTMSSLTVLDPVQRILRDTEAISPVVVSDEDPLSAGTTFYPDSVFEQDWTRRIKVEEILHRSELHSGCVTHKESVVPWTYGFTGNNDSANHQLLINQSDSDLLAKLRECPDIDIFLPGSIRGFGYCEDATSYTYFLKTRMLPRWVFDIRFEDVSRNRSVTYHELCPNTPMLFFNHYWEGVPDAPDWPADKPLWLMPNAEMYELDSEHYWRADVVLCKTAVCTRYLRKWYFQEGNPRDTRVIYTRHTTTNLALTVQDGLGKTIEVPAKNFSDVAFLHIVGTSIQKGTRQVLDCWLSRPDFPTLDIYVDKDLYDSAFNDYDSRVNDSQNIRVHTGRLSPQEIGKVIAQGRYFLCPSLMEGYGHYINQARSSNAFIFTTNVAPMNELITPSSGTLITARTGAYGEQFLGGVSPKHHALRNVSGLVADFSSTALCEAVSTTLANSTLSQLQSHANRAHQQYYFDTVFFAHKMQALRDFSRAQSHPRYNHHYMRS